MELSERSVAVSRASRRRKGFSPEKYVRCIHPVAVVLSPCTRKTSWGWGGGPWFSSIHRPMYIARYSRAFSDARAKRYFGNFHRHATPEMREYPPMPHGQASTRMGRVGSRKTRWFMLMPWEALRRKACHRTKSLACSTVKVTEPVLLALCCAW